MKLNNDGSSQGSTLLSLTTHEQSLVVANCCVESSQALISTKQPANGSATTKQHATHELPTSARRLQLPALVAPPDARPAAAPAPAAASPLMVTEVVVVRHSTTTVEVPASAVAAAATAAAAAADARRSRDDALVEAPTSLMARDLPPPPVAASASAGSDTLNPLQPDTPRAAAAGSTGASSGGGSARRQQQLLLASRHRDLVPEQVVECDPVHILEGLSLTTQQLGRGSFGTVVTGAYHGLPCAVKVVVADSLDKPALSELLLAPAMNHAHLVQTYTTRCAELTDEFFNFLEGGGSSAATNPSAERRVRDPTLPRLLLPITNLNSGDGFGDPGCGIVDVRNPYAVLHALLFEVKAAVGQHVMVIVQELCAKSTLHNAIRRGTFKLTPQWTLRLARRALLRTAVEVARGLLHLHEMAHVLPRAASKVDTVSNGSPAYMAPEALQGSVSRASDVWSFGVCLHEMLTGERPFSDVQAENGDALVAAIREGRVRLQWPDARRLDMANGIIAIGKRCMSARPEDRPGFVEVIEELVNTERIIRAERGAGAGGDGQGGGAVGGGAAHRGDSGAGSHEPTAARTTPG